jgi:MoaA/NifB/PqqE/SkfB family radical SAM enzyme
MLISAVRTSGAETIVFAGGDPSIRPDLSALFEFSKELKLKVEVQTNAHRVSADFLSVLKRADMVGLSLDGPNPETHDAFRGAPGNFERVLEVMGVLRQSRVPVILRTVVSKPNHQTISKMSRFVELWENVVRWSLLEFSAIGQGYVNRAEYEINQDAFDRIGAEVRANFRGSAQVDLYSSEAKAGTYALVTPAGLMYGTGHPPTDGIFPLLGSIIHEHLSVLACKLPFSRELHAQRYAGLATL